MQLGAKVERPAPKKPDPIKEFETGMHDPDGSVWRYAGVDHASVDAEEDEAWALFVKAREEQATESQRLLMKYHDLRGQLHNMGVSVNLDYLKQIAGIRDTNASNTQMQKLNALLLEMVDDHLKSKQRTILDEPPVSPRQAARTELMQDFKTLHDTYIRLGIDFNPFEIRRTAGVPIDSRPTNAQLGKMIDVMISALETHI